MTEIPAAILAQLNRGEIETANLVEWLALNQISLLYSINFSKPLPADWPQELQTLTTNQQVQKIGILLFDWAKSENILEQTWNQIYQHRSDMVRQWACYWVYAVHRHNITDLLDYIYPYAKDDHFGVRETAWMAARPVIAQNLGTAIELLEVWVTDPEANVRRFAIEVLRPCGVWTKHIPQLKKNPEMAAHLLEHLCADPSKYVQNSVANWLNDAGKSRPDWVKDICSKWTHTKEKLPETQYIIRRALRNLQP